MTITAKKFSSNPILTPTIKENRFDRACVYNPAAVVKNDKVFLIYRGEDDYYKRYISRLGLAVSSDGFHFQRVQDNPVMSENTEDPFETQGCEDPRLIQLPDGRFYLTYVAFGGGEKDKKLIRLSAAFSTDLIHWDKIGRIIPGNEKSGAIIQDYQHNGQYVMYFGDNNLRIAYSKDLVQWDVEEKPVLSIRENFFDSHLIEGGPPPIITDAGIVVIYNSAQEGLRYGGGKNWLSYAPGYALFDKKDPSKLIERSSEPFMAPSEYWECYGKVNYVIFATGLVRFHNKWLLYYGGADKSIGVAELQLID